jgi:polyisoprenoid-binding protein YceI
MGHSSEGHEGGKGKTFFRRLAMKRSRWNSIVPSALALALCMAVVSRADTYQLDPVHSTGVFSIHHFNAGYVWGLIGQPTGTIEYDAADATKLAFTVSVSLDNLDTQNARRDADLKGPDWFNAKQFPTIDFKSTAVKKTGDTTYDVTGDLTMHGVTKSVTVSMEMTGVGQGMQGETRLGFQTTFTVHREDFDLKTDPGAVGDDVRITVALEGIKQ